MIGKIVSLPFWIIFKVAGMLFGSIKLVFTIVTSLLRTILGHVFGAIIGGTVGFLFGRKHVGIKIFPGHKKPKLKPCK